MQACAVINPGDRTIAIGVDGSKALVSDCHLGSVQTSCVNGVVVLLTCKVSDIAVRGLLHRCCGTVSQLGKRYRLAREIAVVQTIF